MHDDLLCLIKLQEVDSKIFLIEREVSGVPKEIKVLSDRHAGVDAEYKGVKGSNDAAKKEMSDLTIEGKEKEEMLDNSKKKLAGVQNHKDYKVALQELDNMHKSIDAINARITELKANIEIFDEQEKQLAVQETDLSKLLNERETNRQDKMAGVTSELEELKVSRKGITVDLTKRLLSKYEQVRRARNNIAVVRVENETCTGCYMKVPPQLYVEVKKELELHQCPNCQRFLYFENGQ